MSDAEAPSANIGVFRTHAIGGTVLASAFGNGGVAVIVTDLDLDAPGAVIRHVNPAFEEVTGYAAEEVLGRSPRLLQDPLADQAALRRLKRALMEGVHCRTATVNYHKNGEEYVVDWVISRIGDGSDTKAQWFGILRDVSQERRLRQQFAAELQHRTRNLLATVRSIASRTLAETGEATVFAERLAALGRIQGLLSRNQGQVDLDVLIRAELGAHPIRDGQVTIEGETVALPCSHVEILALALHELTTNARKHGALATETGILSIRWAMSGSGRDRWLTLHWEEVRAQPLHGIKPGRGYGREVVESALPFSLGARTELEFRPLGIRCRIDLPVPDVMKPSSFE